MHDLEIFEELVALKQKRLPAVLATVVESRGSVPRKAGAKMLIRADGTSLGTVGGGPVEVAVTEAAPEVLRSAQPRTLCFRLTEDEGYVCGGEVRIFLEPMGSVPRLLIVGNGHIGRATREAAVRTGFDAEIIDWLENPSLPQVDAQTNIVVATREHALDFQAVATALQTDAAFIGLIGSRRKRQALVDFLAHRGFAQEAIDRVVSPVGLAIGAETPEEIAISIVAQLIERNRGRGHGYRSDTAGSRAVETDGAIEAAPSAG
jgi:xanthine dehydrogenase accessory factor